MDSATRPEFSATTPGVRPRGTRADETHLWSARPAGWRASRSAWPSREGLGMLLLAVRGAPDSSRSSVPGEDG